MGGGEARLAVEEKGLISLIQYDKSNRENWSAAKYSTTLTTEQTKQKMRTVLKIKKSNHSIVSEGKGGGYKATY